MEGKTDMDLQHVIAELIVQDRQRVFESEDWKRRAALSAAARPGKDSAGSKRRRALRWRRTLVVLPEGSA
jgi:hypothetical protein